MRPAGAATRAGDDPARRGSRQLAAGAAVLIAALSVAAWLTVSEGAPLGGLSLAAGIALLFAARLRAVALFVVVGAELAVAHAALGMPEWVSAEQLSQPQQLIATSSLSLGARIAVNPAVGTSQSADSKSRQRLLPLRFVEDGLSGVTLHHGPVPSALSDVMEVADVVMLEMFAAAYAIGYWHAPANEDLIELSPWPRVWLVAATERADEDEARATFFAQPRKAEEVAVGEGLPALAGALADGCTAELTALAHEEMTVRTSCAVPTVLVTSDLWFPGWTAQGAPPLRVNYLMRGVPLDGGAHEVRFTYRPTHFPLGAASSALALLALAVVRLRRPRRPR